MPSPATESKTLPGHGPAASRNLSAAGEPSYAYALERAPSAAADLSAGTPLDGEHTPSPSERPRTASSNGPRTHRTQGPLVFLVDDDPGVLATMQDILEFHGFRVRTFERGEPALAALETDNPEAILSDVRMPGIDGLELALKALERYPEMPLMLISAYSEPNIRTRAEEHHIPMLSKPVDIDAVISFLQRQLT